MDIKYIPLVTALVLLLTACSQNAAPTEAEQQMAAMMGITVEELRSQTNEEHMQMMMDMNKKGFKGHGNHMNRGTTGAAGFLPAQEIDIATLPEAKPTEVLQVRDGDTIKLNPMIVRKTIYGKQFAMYGYNGQIPGPTIKVTQSATVTVDVTNKIDMPTTIHWHGLRLDNKSDGIPGVTQEEILPNGTYRYTVTFPDEGIYWYHPHVREDIQQDLGLYGNLLVAPTLKDAYAPVNAEQVVVLDDLSLTDAGLETYGATTATKPLMGRFGNVVLVNGDTDTSFTYNKGSVVRFYVTNVANTRTFKFGFPGAKVKLVGSDVGRYEREEWVENIIIAPAERYIVDVLFAETGTFAMQHKSPADHFTLASITILDTLVTESFSDSFTTLRTNQDVADDVGSFKKYFNGPVDKTLELTVDLNGMDHSGMMMDHGTNDGIEWEDTMPMMNEMMTGDQVQWKLIDTETKKENMDIHWQFKVGDVKKIKIINSDQSDHPMQHPIHFHGQRFLVLGIDGVQTTNFVWKDTVLIPAGSTAEILLDITNPGDWMFHCHIAEHLTNGMMGMFTVTEL